MRPAPSELFPTTNEALALSPRPATGGMYGCGMIEAQEGHIKYQTSHTHIWLYLVREVHLLLEIVGENSSDNFRGIPQLRTSTDKLILCLIAIDDITSI